MLGEGKVTRLSEYLEVVGVLRCSNFAILRISLSVYFSCLDAFNRFNSSDHFARSKISFFFFFFFLFLNNIDLQ